MPPIHRHVSFTLTAYLFVLPVTRMDRTAGARQLPRISYALSIGETAAREQTAELRAVSLSDSWLTCAGQTTPCCTTTYYQVGISETQLGIYPYLSVRIAKKQHFLSIVKIHRYCVTSYNLSRYFDRTAAHSTSFQLPRIARPAHRQDRPAACWRTPTRRRTVANSPLACPCQRVERRSGTPGSGRKVDANATITKGFVTVV